ncbi:MAG: hypothetical protein HYY20_01785 [Candidatus Tectomicrobia bacterium]|uniref:Uncharacterized protein n=1 Tax=Tectimicrobiota bacterium TaxID=2528274 RepID=A0A932FVP6_UNCTE|nr:hypothetical protein [Candidatus Tectomicrobia bacterium]
MKNTKDDREPAISGHLGLLVTGAIIVTSGVILLVSVLATYVIIGRYVPGGERFLLASLVLWLIGYGIFFLGNRLRAQRKAADPGSEARVDQEIASVPIPDEPSRE